MARWARRKLGALATRRFNSELPRLGNRKSCSGMRRMTILSMRVLVEAKELPSVCLGMRATTRRSAAATGLSPRAGPCPSSLRPAVARVLQGLARAGLPCAFQVGRAQVETFSIGTRRAPRLAVARQWRSRTPATVPPAASVRCAAGA